MTQEDAVPAWLMKVIGPAGFSWGKTPADWKANLSRVSSGYRLKIPALCATCNNAWLGPIEKRAKPKLMAWMQGIYSPMTHDDQRLLSFWMVKTAMTIQIAQALVAPVIPMAQYRELHTARTHPPAGFYVWVQIRPRRHGVLFGLREVFVEPPMGPAYEVSLDIRQLSLRMIGSHGADTDKTAKSISQIEGYETAMLQIWPTVSRHLIAEPFVASTSGQAKPRSA